MASVVMQFKLHQIMVVIFNENTIVSCAVPLVVRLMDNFFHVWLAIKRKRACKEVKIYYVNCCCSRMEKNPSSFLKGTYGSKYIDCCGFVGPIRDSNVFFGSMKGKMH